MRKPGHGLRGAVALAAVAAAFAGAVAWSAQAGRAHLSGHVSQSAGTTSQAHDVRQARVSYAAQATISTRLLERSYYNGTGLWHMCLPVICNTKNRDWGADSVTNLLWLRWELTGDRSVLPIMRVLVKTAPTWLPGDLGSSDSIAWDAVADVRLYQATGMRLALVKARDALRFVQAEPGLGTGACPAIDYQWPHGERGNLKTIETASNYIKAALLLYKITGRHGYLRQARSQYAQVRRYFLDRKVQLYSAYMFDNGTSCPVLPGQYFASVNGNMIWAGSELAALTGDRDYLRQAITTARAVRSRLSDAAGVFADLQADNDIVAPLVEAMYRLATVNGQRFATGWLLDNASAAGSDVNPAGQFGRFFDGPPPYTVATVWQINGGIALMDAAGAIDPGGFPADPGFWEHAPYVSDRQTLTGSRVTISFTGRAIAIMGTIGAQCCVQGHAEVYVDGVRTVNQAGIWQNYSSPSRMQPNQVLFAWRWTKPGHHVITIRPASFDPEEGGSFFAMTGYLLVR